MTLSPSAVGRCLLPLFATLFALPLPAQLISIKTVPIANGDQFDILPSQNAAMGGVSIALADSLIDPFINPAKGARIGGTRVFGSPTFYGFSEGEGGGRTFPLGAMARGGAWFGGVALAFQEVDPSFTPQPFFFPGPLVDLARPADLSIVPQQTISFPESPRDNRYAFATAGRSFASAGLSVGAGLRWAGLHAVDGVDLLYANSSNIRQYGDLLDLRIGAVKELGAERTLEVIALHSRVDMTHDVSYVDFIWDPVARIQQPKARVEHNLDKTNVWGLHVEYERPLVPGWRLGTVMTANRMSHPKIPNYELMNIPRDPGHSYAYNVGVGLGKVGATGTFGVDLILEPIWSNTWAEAESAIERVGGGVIPAGGKTIENRFRFTNATVRFGVAQDVEVAGRTDGMGIQLGLDMRQIDYSLDQTDNIQRSRRRQDENWVEWTPTWGLSLRFPALHIQYRGRMTTGTGRPGVTNINNLFRGGLNAADGAPSILLAPSGELFMDEVSVTSHQISLSLPIR